MMVHLYTWAWNPKPQTSFLLLSCLCFLARQTILRTRLVSLITVREASEANSDHCLVSGKIVFLPLSGSCWVGDLMPDTFPGCCWCLTRLWQWVMWLPCITFCKTAISPIKMQLLHCPFTHNTGPHTCTTSNCNCSAIALIASDAHSYTVFCTTENTESKSTDAALMSSRLAYSVSSLIISSDYEM